MHCKVALLCFWAWPGAGFYFTAHFVRDAPPPPPDARRRNTFFYLQCCTRASQATRISIQAIHEAWSTSCNITTLPRPHSGTLYMHSLSSTYSNTILSRRLQKTPGISTQETTSGLIHESSLLHDVHGVLVVANLGEHTSRQHSTKHGTWISNYKSNCQNDKNWIQKSRVHMEDKKMRWWHS